MTQDLRFSAWFSALAASCAFATCSSAKQLDGKALLAKHCGRCHAIGKSDESPLNNAPPLREIYRRYPTERLEFELSEGTGSGHLAMPQIQFSTEQISDILEYLKGQSNTK